VSVKLHQGCVITTASKLLITAGLVVLPIALAAGTVSAQPNRRAQSEQSRFGAEIPIRRGVQIPSDVLSILRKDKRNQTCLEANETPNGPGARTYSTQSAI
jgi:hypothetical protein